VFWENLALARIRKEASTRSVSLVEGYERNIMTNLRCSCLGAVCYPLTLGLTIIEQNNIPQTGVEPVTYRLEGGCSIQLSY
jgi:hypothetical protein